MACDPKLYEHLSNTERMLQGFPYNFFDPGLAERRLKCRKLVREFNKSPDDDLDNRARILKQLFSDGCGENIFIEPNFRCDYGDNITIGENAYFNFDCCILDPVPVRIGKQFLAAPGVHIYAATHPTDPIARRHYEFAKGVTIGDDVWIGGQAIICPGVTIGNCVVVGAGSVVIKDVPDNVVVAGNPAKIVKHLPPPNATAKIGIPTVDADPSEYEHLSNWDRMLQGHPYNCVLEDVVHNRERSRELTKALYAIPEENVQERRAALSKLLHADSAPDVSMEGTTKFDYGFQVTIGENSHISYDCCILDVVPVKIGKNFTAGPRVQIYTASHPLDAHRRRGCDFGLPVTIGDDVWLGGRSIVCPGVTIGNGVVVEPGSVVTKDIPDFAIVAGAPARVVGTIKSTIDA